MGISTVSISDMLALERRKTHQLPKEEWYFLGRLGQSRAEP
jgi:hypothetical protein